jgi:hypothetical protein
LRTDEIKITNEQFNRTPVSENITVSNCKSESRSSKNASKVEIICKAGYLYITHKDLVLNCCYEEVKVAVSVSGNTIELDIIEKEPYGCRCTCPFDISYSVGKFKEGEYLLIIKLNGTQIHSQTIVI